MKNDKLNWISWMVCVLLLVSCKSGDEYESALPQDAAMVVSFNPVSIVEKSGLAGKEGEAKVQRLGDALKSGMQGSEQLVDKIMEDPSESGIDFRKTYMYLWNRNRFLPVYWHGYRMPANWNHCLNR